MAREGLRCIVRVLRTLWEDHEDLMAASGSYRHSLHTGIIAILQVLRAHPLLAVIANALLALYVAAHERNRDSEDSPFRPRATWATADW